MHYTKPHEVEGAWPTYIAGHILRKIYNCTERKKIEDLERFTNFL